MPADNTKNKLSRGNRRGRPSFGAKPTKPNPDYTAFILRVTLKPNSGVTIHEDATKFPTVVSDGYQPDEGIESANATINGVTYTFPRDFTYNYTSHDEIDNVTGEGLALIREKITFKNLPGTPTLVGFAEEKFSGLILSPEVDISGLECFGNFQLTGTGIFKNVKGSGIGICGVSTKGVIYHFAWIKGWPIQ